MNAPQKKFFDKKKKFSSDSFHYYICGGPYMMRDCLKIGKMSALGEEKEDPREQPSVKMGSL